MLKGLLRRLTTRSPACIDIGYTLADEHQTVCKLIKDLQPAIECREGGGWELDLSSTTYLGPYAATLILSTCLRADQLNQRYDIRFPENHPKIKAFRAFSGLDHWLDDAPLPDQNHPHNVTVPLRQVENTTFETHAAVSALVRRFAVLDPEQDEYLSNSISETLQNVEDHADSPVGAIFCARFLDNPKRVRVAIVDRGNGILTTLRREHPDTRDAMVALGRVIKGGYTSRSRQSNMGTGVSNLWKAVVHQLRGQICIVSEEGIAYNWKKVSHRLEGLGYRFPGTCVFFSVPVADS